MAFPFPLMVSPCLEKGKHSSLPCPPPIPYRFLSPYILLAAGDRTTFIYLYLFL